MHLPPSSEIHQTELERARTLDLMRILPRGYGSVLDAGARDGYYSTLLADYFTSVIALDINVPPRAGDTVWLKGDLTKLPFSDNCFDVVFCTEVLEHIPALEQACAEIARVVKHAVVIGVPYRQDTRIGRSTCWKCGRSNPPWGHVNSFNEQKLIRLFPNMRVRDRSLIGNNRDGRTSTLAVWLMDMAGNPWGIYDQSEPCLYCGMKLRRPSVRSMGQRLSGAIALQLNRIQSRLATPHANWIHMVFQKQKS
jgi:SAM-dependent methyltransferase